MKKLILSIAILAVMTFVACSEDEKDYTPNYLGCMHCAIPEEEGYEVCVDENGNAFVGDADTGIQLEQYFDLFCDNEPQNPGQPAEYTDCVMCVAPGGGETKICKGANDNAFTFSGNTGTDTGIVYATYLLDNCETTVEIPVNLSDCKTCAESGMFPEVEICKGDNGHAYVDGVDMMVNYSSYITQYENLASTSCD